ncbi:hypothetical protein DERP_001534 [Dermatophagoides pteronyssinus]|uniref:Uncharacterized protein n=1 Tax=Dermatophagoides pteronyssinus TaxID=6956 RepID=A0ABQ8JAW2_DERPT|nr:hypothetical protein DERP_001534 [Dermatophagoides pteronyssinus]
MCSNLLPIKLNLLVKLYLQSYGKLKNFIFNLMQKKKQNSFQGKNPLLYSVLHIFRVFISSQKKEFD